MKQNLLLLMVLLYCSAVNAQSSLINPQRSQHDSVLCAGPLTGSGCNVISNAAFRFTGDSLEAFSNGDVAMWQDVNNLTTDVNGALAAGMGWNMPAIPIVLTGANMASMLVDNLDIQTEGIAGKTMQVDSGKTYALSFFLATSKLSGYRSAGGAYRFKIFLASCQNFTLGTSGNPVIIGSKQLVYCREFTEMKDSEWQQYLVSFTAGGNYNMIVIYPEVSSSSFNGGAYVHLLYPELVPVNPTATYFDTTGSIAGKTTLTACGLMNAQYQWVGPNGFVTNQLSFVMNHTGNELPTDDYTFNMWIPDAIGNLPELCSDAVSPVIEAPALKKTGILAFDCSDGSPPIAATGCNLIPNAGFATIDPLSTVEAFLLDNVLNWASVVSFPIFRATSS